MGAHSDSLRFQWEIAHDLGISRDRVSAEVVGEHGPMMIPRWSTVQIRGMPEKEQQRCLWRIYQKDREAETEDFDALFARRHSAIMEELRRLKEGRVGRDESIDILKTIEGYRPDFRVILKPLVVHRSNSGTAHATGVAAASLIQAILSGAALAPNAQRMVPPPGEPAGAAFPFGLPTPLMELFRFSGTKEDRAWAWRERVFTPGTFRAQRAEEESRRIDLGIAAMRRQSAEWQKGMGA